VACPPTGRSVATEASRGGCVDVLRNEVATSGG
jgi:hypothetical protein